MVVGAPNGVLQPTSASNATISRMLTTNDLSLVVLTLCSECASIPNAPLSHAPMPACPYPTHDNDPLIILALVDAPQLTQLTHALEDGMQAGGAGEPVALRRVEPAIRRWVGGIEGVRDEFEAIGAGPTTPILRLRLLVIGCSAEREERIVDEELLVVRLRMKVSQPLRAECVTKDGVVVSLPKGVEVRTHHKVEPILHQPVAA